MPEMIVADVVNAVDGSPLGRWEFDHLPRQDELIVLRTLEHQAYGVVQIEHYPTERLDDPADLNLGFERRIIVRVPATKEASLERMARA